MCSLIAEDVGVAAECPLEELARDIRELAAHLAAATCRWLLMIAEFDAREGWRPSGVISCAHWLSWQCGIGLGTSREHVRVARALRILPEVRGAFGSGELSYTKVRAITRVADDSTEARLVEFAREATGQQLDRIVGGFRGALEATVDRAAAQEMKQSLECHWDEDGMLVVRGRLTPEDGAALMSALEVAQDQVPEAVVTDLGTRARRAQALVVLARGSSEQAAPCELVVHVDAETVSGDRVRERSELESGPVLAPETIRRLGCDAAVVEIIERDGEPLSVGRRTRVIPPALRRALRSRDDARCRFPGCSHRRYLHAHHVIHWAHGGRTEMSNLVQLCSHHHRLVHEGGYGVSPAPDGHFRFTEPGGWEIPDVCKGEPAGGHGIEQQNRQRRMRIDDRTCVPRSGGGPCDYGIAVEGLCRLALGPPVIPTDPAQPGVSSW
jgi:hypothetical protein